MLRVETNFWGRSPKSGNPTQNPKRDEFPFGAQPWNIQICWESGQQRAKRVQLDSAHYAVAPKTLCLSVFIGHGVAGLPEISRSTGREISETRASSGCAEGLSQGAPGIPECGNCDAQERRTALPDGLGLPGKR
jgi:hypothetical protein